jgi:hypothetical protein
MNLGLENEGGMVILPPTHRIGVVRGFEIRARFLNWNVAAKLYGRERLHIGADRLRPSWRHEMMSRLPIALFAMLGALGAGQSAGAPVAPPNAGLPAIDAVTPAKTETATFALG